MNRYQINKHILLALLLVSPLAWGQDWSLAQAVQRGLQVQAATAAAEDSVHAAVDLGQAANADRMPQLSLRAGSIWTQSPNGQPVYVSANGAREVIGELGIVAPLYAPQLQALASVARDNTAIARSQRQTTRLQVATQIVNFWFQLALTRNLSSLWQQTVAQDQTLYDRTREAFRAGAAARLSLVQTKLLLTQALSSYQQAKIALATAMQSLNLQLHLPVSTPTGIDWRPAHLIPPPLPQLWQNAEQSQPLLRVAQQQIRQGQSQVQLQRSATDPTINANIAYGVDTATVPRQNDLGWQAGITLNLPIFGFGRNQDRIAAAKAHLAALQAAKRALVLQIRSQISRDFGSFRQAETAYRHSQKAAQEARQVYGMTLHGFRAGAIDALALSQAQTNLVQAQLAVAKARIQEHLLFVQLSLDEGYLP